MLWQYTFRWYLPNSAEPPSMLTNVNTNRAESMRMRPSAARCDLTSGVQTPAFWMTEARLMRSGVVAFRRGVVRR
jgi:hypothetical protein